jgi:glycerophosphoryl diester phosphodiesterase
LKLVIDRSQGAAALAPENTMMSFRKAMALKVDMIELDVHVCSTGEIVVIHDETVDRTTNGSGAVSDLSLSEIMELDAGLGEKISTLDGVMDNFFGKVGINIELKGKGSSRPVGKILEKYLVNMGPKHVDLLVSSFKPDELLDLSDMGQDIPMGFVLEDHVEMGLEFASEIGAWSVHPRKDLLDVQLMNEVRSRGLKVLTWTVNDQNWLNKVTTLGVDGIFTDDPELVSF